MQYSRLIFFNQKTKTILSIVLFFLFAAGCQKKESVQKNDFESLMGKDFPAWQHVQTKDDFENLAFFKEVFEANRTFLSSQEQKIPKKVHFIWLGPKPFPRESIENVRMWLAKNPDWDFYFWTDRARPLPHPNMQLRMVKDFPFLRLKRFYDESDNYGEKSDLLRYEILFREGGVYVDHDVKCLNSFAAIANSYDLFCGMEMPYATTLASSVFPTNNLLGARPAHPVLEHCLEWLTENWNQIQEDYPGNDRDSVICRVSHRTFYVLGHCFKQWANQEGNRDIAFPAFYFNAPKDELALFARHLYAGSWFENESKFEKMVRERLMKLSKKSNQLLLFCTLLGALNLVGFSAFLFFRFKTHRQRADKSSPVFKKKSNDRRR